MKHVVMFSGGIGSWAAAKRVAQQYGTDDLYLVFTDVKGNNKSDNVGEDPDTYRFIDDAVANIGGQYVYINTGKDIWDVFKEHNFLGNSRLTHCSRDLKQKPARDWLEANCDPEDTVVYVGIDWTETHRMPAIIHNYLPYKAEAPMTDAPFMSKSKMIEWAIDEGVKPPRLYELGFSHNNCGGGCVRAGQGQFKQLLLLMPERFAEWERQENEMRSLVKEKHGKDVAILRRSINGEKQPLPLTQLRKEITDQSSLIDDYDIGGCGCFLDFDNESKTE